MKFIKKFIGEDKQLIKDNFILFSTTMVLHLLGFLFHFYVSRKLGPIDYGIFGSLLSVIYLFTVPLNTIQTAISKFVANFKVENNYRKINFLLRASLKKLAVYGVIGTVIFIALSPFVSKFLNTSITPLIVLSFFILFALLLPINRGTMQGLQKFKPLGFNLALEGIVKLFGGILLVSIGWGVSGAIGAFVLAYIIPFAFGFYPIKSIFKERKESFNTKNVYKYSIPVVIMLLSLTAFYSLDVILVRHFLDPLQVGFYAALSLIGKVLFFGSFSIVQVMFPKVAELYAMNKPHKKILYKSLIFVSIFCMVSLLMFYLFPNFFVNLFFGKDYLEVSKYLVLFSVFITFLSLNFTLSFYNVSLNRYKFIYLLIVFNILQIALLSIFHSSIMQVIYILLFLMVVLFVILLLITRFSNETVYNNPSKERREEN